MGKPWSAAGHAGLFSIEALGMRSAGKVRGAVRGGGVAKGAEKGAKVEDATKASQQTGSVGTRGTEKVLRFGKNANQISHVFRRTDALGLNRSVVKSEVETHLRSVSSQMVAGKPFNQIITISGQRIQYTAFRLSDGTVNIGRIHGVK